MKITSIDIYDLLPEIANQGIAPICIRVNTDEGICGFGDQIGRASCRERV